MTAPWTADELALLDAATELEIAVHRPDGGAQRSVPIWVVCSDGEVYVRTWYRRDTGWFGAALRARRAGIRVPGLEAEVTVEDLGNTDPDVTSGVDAAYRAKYGAGAGSMVSVAAVESTLRLDRV